MRKIVALVFTAGLSTCLGQADRAAVNGTISDPTHAAIGGANVKLVYPATGLERETATSSVGVFQIAELPIGAECYLEASAPGFRTVQTKAFFLEVGETRTLNLSLEIATVGATVNVQDVVDPITMSNAAVDSLTSSQRLNDLPVNGRNWMSFMALAPGAVDGANGSNTAVRFYATAADDENYRVDGMDATSIRNQNMRLNSRLLMSEDAIAEFRVNSAMFSADSGGSIVGQVEVVTKSGSNSFHGSAFEYARNAFFDARPFFQPGALLPFGFNQYGGSVGGPVFKNQTFFFLSYEGLRQTQNLASSVQDVPSVAFRNMALAESPAIAPLINAFPLPTASTSNPQIGTWQGPEQNIQNEDVGTVRIDHRFNDDWSGYFRFTRNAAFVRTPDSLQYGTSSYNGPVNGVVELLQVVSPRTTNEIRMGANWVPWQMQQDVGNVWAISVTPFATAPDSLFKQTHSLTENILDNVSTQRGAHNIKAGIEIRRVVISNYYSYDGTISYSSLANFAANIVDSVVVSGLNPAVTDPKTEYFGFVQDEWKIRPNITINAGLRYDFFNELKEAHGRTYGFNLQTCGGYCPYGSQNGTPDFTNFGPRLGVAWAPEKLHGNTVVRVGGGIYYGDGQVGNQLAFTYNDGDRFDLTQASNPGLAYPIALTTSAGIGTAPDETDRYRRSEMSNQWTAQIQQRLGSGFTAQVTYLGMENTHLFDEQADNVINPLTGKQYYPQFNQVEHKGNWGIGRFQGLITSLQRTMRNGLFVGLNYTWSHSDGDISDPENVTCRACSFGNLPYDVRQNLYIQSSYPLPLGHNIVARNWTLSGVASIRTGFPLLITVSRATTAMLDGNNTNQQPNLVPGVSLIPADQTIHQWLNPKALSVPANDTWGNLGTEVGRGPGLVQLDTAISRRINLTERMNVMFRMEVFNLFNHPNFANPNVNFSSPQFGMITSIVNTTPIGTGTGRSVQFAARFTF